jgi:hypothetical protein
MNVYLAEYLEGFPEYIVADSYYDALEMFKADRPHADLLSMKKLNKLPVLMQQQYDKTSEVQNENK